MPNGAKHWCFTINNYNADEHAQLVALGSERAGVAYIVVGKEVGESGTPHLQGFISFEQRRSLHYVRTYVSARAHFEPAKGKPSQAAAYCKKDGDYIEFGSCPGGAGRRCDIHAAVEAVKNGMGRRELIETYPGVYSRCSKSLDTLLYLYGPKRNWVPNVYVFWGAPGTGKSRKAFEMAKDPYVHTGSGWFDGYCDHEDVIIDDFDGSEFKLAFFLKVLDRYALKVPVKGAHRNFVPRRIFITANYPPEEWYPNGKPFHVMAMMRRFKEVIEFGTEVSADGSMVNFTRRCRQIVPPSMAHPYDSIVDEFANMED